MISKHADIARFLGASSIFYYHIGIGAGYPLSNCGEWAVDFFIILSGIAYACFSSARPSDGPSYGRYVKSRLASLFPMFIAVNALLFLASYIYPSSTGKPFTFLEFLLSATGLSQYLGYRYLSTVMWFVPLILQAYLLFPLVDYLLNRINATLLLVASLLLSLLFIALAYFLWPSTAMGICRNWTIAARLPEVCIGLIAGRSLFCRRDLQGGVGACAVFAVLAIPLGTVVAQHFAEQSTPLSWPLHGLAMSALIAALAMAAVKIFGPLLDGKALRLVGTASFPFFLMHGAGVLLVHKRFGYHAAPAVIYFLLCWGFAVVLTFLFGRAMQTLRTKRPATAKTVSV